MSIFSTLIGGAISLGSKLLGGGGDDNKSSGYNVNTAGSSNLASSNTGLMSPMNTSQEEQDEIKVAATFGDGTNPWELQKRVQSWYPTGEDDDA